MLAPKSIGMAISSGRPPAIMPTTIEVVVDDDWMMAVVTIPIARPTNGFSAKENSSLAWSPAASLKPSPIMPTPLSSSQTPTNTAIQLMICLVVPVNGRNFKGSLS